jgi:hypothetical protein
LPPPTGPVTVSLLAATNGPVTVSLLAATDWSRSNECKQIHIFVKEFHQKTTAYCIFFQYLIQHCFICRPLDFTVLEDAAIDPGQL